MIVHKRAQTWLCWTVWLKSGNSAYNNEYAAAGSSPFAQILRSAQDFAYSRTLCEIEQRSKLFMVILINGASCTGKTYLSQRILERFSYTYYSIDHIKMGLYRGDPNCNFSPTDDNNKISKSLAPIIEGIIRTSLENDQNLTIEGCYYESESIMRLQNEYPDKLISISIVLSDDYCKNHFQRNIQKFRSIIENRKYEEDRTIEQFIEENKQVLSFSQKNGFHVFEVNKEYGSTIEAVMHFIGTRLLCSTSHNSE